VNLQELNELDFSNIGDWPLPVKLVIVLVVMALVGVGWYYLITQDQLTQLARVEKQEKGLRAEFEKKQAKAANLEAYKRQLEEMKQSFGAMLRQLPNQTEVPELLVDVSQTGLAAGLEFELFRPMGEVPKDFYAELPIQLRVRGEYHEFGEFISGLAALPRIVTIHNVDISGVGSELTMIATAKTYRYLDEGAGR
jgi:type IV pilus assembly protein PilO